MCPNNFDIDGVVDKTRNARRNLLEPPKNPTRFIVNNLIKGINNIDIPRNPLQKAANYTYIASDFTSAINIFAKSPWLSTLASRGTVFGHALTVTGFLYNHLGGGSWSAGNPRELWQTPEDKNRNLYTQGFENPFAIKRALENGGTFYDAYLRVKTSLGYPVSYNYSDFERSLAASNLIDTYKNTHPNCRIEESLRSNTDIGGVASDVGIIAGLKDGLEDVLADEAIFCFASQDGHLPCSNLELKEMIRTLANGILLHNTVPFFDLRFNKKGALCPVIHPAYQNTIVGRIISLLDYFMKCYTAGAFYSEDFLQGWHASQNFDEAYLKTQVTDFKDYCKQHRLPNYHSLFQALAYDNINVLDSTEKLRFQVSFRIISQQKNLQQHNNVFIINSDFRVEYTIEPFFEYKEELEQYLKQYGHYPEDYKKFDAICKKMANTIKRDMPKLPFLRKYFDMLGIMGFFSYYFTTLLDMGKSPVLDPSLAASQEFIVPRAFPPVPIRHYDYKTVTLNFKAVFDCLMTKNPELLRSWAQDALENPGEFFPMTTHLKKIIHDKIYSQFPEDAQIEDLQNLNLIETKLYNHFLNDELRRILAEIHADLQKAINDIGLNLKQLEKKYFWGQSYQAAEKAPLAEQIERLKTYSEQTSVQINVQYTYPLTAEDKVQIAKLEEKKLANINLAEAASIKQFEDSIRAQVPLGQEHLYTSSTGLPIAQFRQNTLKKIHDDFAERRKKLYEISEEYRKAKLEGQLAAIEKCLKNPLAQLSFEEKDAFKARILYSSLYFNAAPHTGITTRVVGGCGVSLPKLNPSKLANPAAFEGAINQVLAESKSEDFAPLFVNNKNYAVFKLRIADQPVYSKIDQTEFSDKLIKGAAQAKIGEKEISAMSHFMTDILQGKKEQDRQLSFDFNPLAKDCAGQTLTHYAASYSGLEPEATSLLSKTSQARPDAFLAKDAQGNLAIHTAAMAGNTAAVAYIVSRAPQTLEAKNTQGLTPLMLAASQGHTATVKKLLACNANPNTILSNGMFALYMAIQAKSEETAVAILQANRASVNVTLENGSSPLHLAIESKQSNIALILIREGANLAQRLKADGFTPLHLAAEMALADVCREILLQRFADPNTKLASGKTALHIAAEKGDIKTLQTLLSFSGILVDAITLEGDTSIMLALRKGQTEAALCLAERALVNLRNNKKQTASLIAAKYGQFIVADRLIERGEYPFYTDKQGQSYAYLLLCAGELLRYTEITKSDLAAATRTYNDQTPLSLAMDKGHPLLVTALSQESKSLDSKEEWEKQLVYALKNDELGLLKKLSKSPFWNPSYHFHNGNVKPYHKDVSDIAAEYGSLEVLRWLSSSLKKLPLHRRSADFYGEGLRTGKTAIAELLLEECDAVNIAQAEYNKGRAAHFAAKYGHIQLIEFLHKYGTDFAKTATGFGDWFSSYNAFAAAVKADDTHLLKKLYSLTPEENWPTHLYGVAMQKDATQCLEVIYERQIKGAATSVEMQCDAFRVATEHNNLEEIKKLLRLGLRPQNTRYHDHPLEIACKQGFIDAARLLLPFTNGESQKTALAVAMEHCCIDIVLLFAELGLLPPFYTEELQTLQTSANGNPYLLQALKGQRADYERDKIRLIEALKEANHREFKRLIDNGLPINYANYSFDGQDTPLIHCVLAQKAQWALAILTPLSVDYRIEDADGHDPMEYLLLSYEEKEEKTAQSPMISPFQLQSHHWFNKKPRKMGKPTLIDLAVNKNHPEALEYFNRFSCNRELLFSAALYNHYEWVKALLSHDKRIDHSSVAHDGRLINQIDKKARTALMIAASAGHVKIVELLLVNNADTTCRDIYQNTALHYAILNGHNEIAMQLAALTKNRDSKNRKGLTPLLCAVKQGSIELVKILVRLGCNIQATDIKGLNALHLAAIHNRGAMIDYLVEDLDVNAEVISETEATALHLAALAKSTKAFLALIKNGGDLLRKDNHHITPLEYAVRSNQPEIWEAIAILPFTQDVTLQAPLFLAAAAGDNIEALMYFFETGCPINVVDSQGNTALHFASINSCIKAIAFLIDNKIELNNPNSQGNTALHLAALAGFVSGLRQLAKDGANLNSTNLDGQTALHLACENEHFPAVLQLLKLGVEISIQDKNGLMAIHFALKKKNWALVHLLSTCRPNTLKAPPALAVEHQQFLNQATSMDCSLETRPEVAKIIASYGLFRNAEGVKPVRRLVAPSIGEHSDSSMFTMQGL